MPPLPISADSIPPRAPSSSSVGSTITVPSLHPEQARPDVATDTSRASVTSPNTRRVSLTIDMDIVGNPGDPVSSAVPRPFGNTESRNISESSRETLRRQLAKRKMSLTIQEQLFLDQLVIHGNEVEVQLACEKLQDDHLFFDYQTPRNLKYNNGDPVAHEDDAENKEREANSDDPSTSEKEIAKERPSLVRCSSQGSQRRLAALEQRRNSPHHTQLWKAHQSGLAVTSAASRMSLRIRNKSAETTSTGASASMRRGAMSSDIFRPTAADLRRNSSRNSFQNTSTQSLKASLSAKPVPRPTANARSRSLSMAQLSQSTTSSGKSAPGIPPPVGLSRRSSTSSRKSVTFHQETDGAPKPRPSKSRLPVLRRAVSDISGLHSKKPDQRVSSGENIPASLVSDLSSSPPLVEERSSPYLRQESTSSIPSLHHGHPIRQESVSSIPSLHHAHLIREESIASIPSLHHGHPIRQESTSSVPSLHQGLPVREASFGSIPSLHHGHQLEEHSVASSPNTEEMEEQDARALLFQKYAGTASEEVANRWLLESNADAGLDSNQEGESAIPLVPTYPSTTTETTMATSTGFTLSREDCKPVIVQSASKYDGEGMEVFDFEAAGAFERIPSQVCMDAGSVRTCNSFDTSLASYRHPEIFRNLQRSLSAEDMGQLFLGPVGTKALFRDSSTVLSSIQRPTSPLGFDDEEDDDNTSWDLDSEQDGRFDSWNILKDDYANGYGGGGTLGFRILGTDADDESAQPHVLSPPLMESLQAFMPYAVSEQNFHLKYSMVRDGASLPAFLKRARGVQYSILALETVDGEVFGSFTAQPWRKNWNYFGTGESFLWRMRHSRLERTHGVLEQAHMESEIDVYPFTGENRLIQLCTHNRIGVGGGTPSEKKLEQDDYAVGEPTSVAAHEWGFGLAIDSDFMTGTSSPCVTFGSPSLSTKHSDGSVFEIVNLELWTMTPCYTLAEAEKLELGKLFLERN
eukprot:Nitzschia sp. Nitz4//scaffold225_size51843//40233//43241//NITZ4_006903-RA/size51843-snap-gene-0.6-mRNA-1//1//CDS//3329542699//2851//frame0